MTAHNRRTTSVTGRVVILDLDSWDALGQWGASLFRHGLPVIRVVRPRRRLRTVRRWIDRWQFGLHPVEVRSGWDNDPALFAALGEPTVDVQGPELQVRALEHSLPTASREAGLLHRVPEDVDHELLYDKWRMLSFAASSGVVVPCSWSEYHEAPLPLVIKGRVSAGGQDVAIVRDRRELAATVTEMSMRDNGGLLFQEFLAGGVLIASGVAKCGDLLVHAVCRAEPSPEDPLGPAASLIVVDDANVLRQMTELVQGLGYTGIFCIDFIEEPDRGPVMVDFNPRVFGSWLQLQLAGADFIGAYLHCLELGPAPSTAAIPPGSRLSVRLVPQHVKAWKDLRSAAKTIRSAARVTGWRYGSMRLGQTAGRAARESVRHRRR